MGLLAYISRKLPYGWDMAAREKRKKQELCQRIYNALPSYYRGNKLRDKDVLHRAYNCILARFQGDLIHAIDVSDAPIKLWVEISERAKIIKEQCR